jgi:hypothetical protein
VRVLRHSLVQVVESDWCLQLDDYDMVTFVPMDITDEESLEMVLMQADMAIQYGEDMEPKGKSVYLCVG